MNIEDRRVSPRDLPQKATADVRNVDMAEQVSNHLGQVQCFVRDAAGSMDLHVALCIDYLSVGSARRISDGATFGQRTLER